MTPLDRCNRRQAFSLLEVVLAMALSAIVVYLVAGAIEFHFRQLTVRKTRIEEAQLARAVLRRIADDLRAVVVDRPIDFSSVEQLAKLSEAGSAGQSQGSADSEEADDSESAASQIVNSSLLPTTPGVYGNAYELQVDISRIPRYEEYAVVEQYNDLQGMRLLSDVKTVSYFLLGQSGLGASSLSTTSLSSSSRSASSFSSLNGQSANNNSTNYAMLGLPPGQPLQGLGRRIVDRSATRYALNNADFSFLDQQTELFAPEVTFIQFRYFDGLQWLNEWDTEQLGGIPLAVEIVLAVQPREEATRDGLLRQSPASSQESVWQLDPNHVYRLVVNLPAAELIDTTAATEDEARHPTHNRRQDDVAIHELFTIDSTPCWLRPGAGPGRRRHAGPLDVHVYQSDGHGKRRLLAGWPAAAGSCVDRFRRRARSLFSGT